jgi:mitochondrial import inner membrane translocase subunit TIM17
MKVGGSRDAISVRAPLLGGQFARWGGTYGIWNCAVKSIRQKEDPWKSPHPLVLKVDGVVG